MTVGSGCLIECTFLQLMGLELCCGSGVTEAEKHPVDDKAAELLRIIAHRRPFSCYCPTLLDCPLEFQGAIEILGCHYICCAQKFLALGQPNPLRRARFSIATRIPID
jgi:hypothetical protein